MYHQCVGAVMHIQQTQAPTAQILLALPQSRLYVSHVGTNAADCMYTICFTPACVHRWPFCLDYIVVSVRVDASLVAVKRGFRPRRDVGVVFRVLFSVAKQEEGLLGETGTRPAGGGESSALFPHYFLLMTPLLMGHESCK